MKTNLPKDNIQLMQLLRQMAKEPQEAWTGKLEQAKRKADEFTEKHGIKAMVIRRKKKYDWVTEYFFESEECNYKGKIYYETEPKLDEL